MRYEWFIAKRYLRPLGGATFIFHLTLISMLGVALGVASLIVVLSVMNGFGNYLRSIMVEVRSHIVMEYNRGVIGYESLIQDFEQVDNVKAVSPVVDDLGFLVGNRKLPVAIVGIDPEREGPVTGLDHNLFVGEMNDLIQEPIGEAQPGESIFDVELRTQPYGVFIGQELARSLFMVYDEDVDKAEAFQTVLGETITVYTFPASDNSPTLEMERSLTLVIRGVFETGHYEFDSTFIYVPLQAAQYLTNTGKDRVRKVQVRLEDHSAAATRETARILTDMSREGGAFGYAQTWETMNEAFFSALEIEKLSMNIILKIIILVATFNIIATLFMVVTEKTRDIGLLRAIGAGRLNVMSIFIGLGILIGVLGTLGGILVGYAVCTFIQVYPLEMPGDGIYYLKYLPCDMEFADFVWVSIYTTAVSFLASIYPAIRASRFVIVEALRFN